MGEKGEQTRQMILNEAKLLFARKGFTAVTMKDICERIGLSRGGLYRHFASTDQIFEAIFMGLFQESRDDFKGKMEQGIPADKILQEEFAYLETEMTDQENSLSLAIYEYAVNRNAEFFNKMNLLGRKKWEKLLQYGMDRGEFKNLKKDSIIDLILYSYQGIQMWKRIITIDQKQMHDMLQMITSILVKQE